MAGLLLFALFTSRDDMDALGILGGAAIGIWINRSFRR
jgi:hypothetical protein